MALQINNTPQFGFGGSAKPPSQGLVSASTPSTVAAGTPTNPFANLGIGGNSTVGSSPTFQPISGLLNPTGTHTAIHSNLSGGATPTSTTVTTNPDDSTVSKSSYAGGTGTSGNQQSQSTQPITGNTQTPSGATVNATTGALVSAAPTTYNSVVSGLQNFQTPASSQANQQAQQTYTEAQNLYNELQQSKNNEANAVATQGEQAIPLGDITGRQQVAEQLYQTQQANLGSQLQGVSSLYSPALTAATTGQGQQESALAAAGQLSAPATATQQVGQGTTVLNAQGQPIVTTPYLSGVGSQYPYSVAPTTYGANGQATTYPSGTQTSGGAQSGNNTPYTAGQVQGQAQLGATNATNNAAIIAAQGIQQKINNDIQQNGINSLSSVNAANAINQWIQGNLSNPAYQNFFQDLTDYTQTIAPLIGVSGTMTDMKTAIGQSLLSSTASGATIMQGLENLNQLALNKNAGIAAAGQGSQAVGQNTQSVSTAGSSNTQPITSAVFPGVTWTMNPQTGQWTSSKT